MPAHTMMSNINTSVASKNSSPHLQIPVATKKDKKHRLIQHLRISSSFVLYIFGVNNLGYELSL